MSETEKPIFMEEAEYLDYLKNQQPRVKVENAAPIAQMSLYQLNKDLVRGLKKMSNMDVNHALEKVKEWYEKLYANNKDLSHFAFLNHEKHYFTIFANQYHMDNKATEFIAAVKDILMHYYGDNDVRSITISDESGAVEVWAMWDGEPSVGYIFPYEQGVVYF